MTQFHVMFVYSLIDRYRVIYLILHEGPYTRFVLEHQRSPMAFMYFVWAQNTFRSETNFNWLNNEP